MAQLPRLRSSPVHWLDFWFWPVLRATWEPFSRKNSHFWHYYDSESQHHPTPLVLEADPFALNRYSNGFSMFWATNFGDPTIVVVEADDHDGLMQIAYKTTVGGKTISQRCAVVVEKRFALIMSCVPIMLFAYSYPDYSPVNLRLLEIKKRKELPLEIPLL